MRVRPASANAYVNNVDDVAGRWRKDLEAPSGECLHSLCIDLVLMLALTLKLYVGAGKREYVPIEMRQVVESPKKTPSDIPHSGYVHCDICRRPNHTDETPFQNYQEDDAGIVQGQSRSEAMRRWL